MGDIADMMIEGVLCEGCGVYIGCEVGYPRKCSSCEGPLSKRALRRRRAANRQHKQSTPPTAPE